MAQTKIKSDREPRSRTPAKRAGATGQRTKAVRSGLDSGAATEERSRLIAEAAYYKAAERGFMPGMEMEDWLEAEREVGPPPPAA